jgi:hypothetical protein
VDLLETRRGSAVVIAGIALVFFALRFSLLFGRDPFFDELFTSWLAKQTFAAILAALRYDSGPPLYYFVVHALGLRSVTALRVFSLLCASGATAAILAHRRLGPVRFTAAALLAVYPPSVLLGVDARAYALCALFVTIGVLLVDRQRVFEAAVAFVLAAYTHYYGALFFPLLLLSGARVPSPATRAESDAGEGTRAPLRTRVYGFLGAVALFGPALLLAFHQPVEATRWLTSVNRIDPLTHIGFAAKYPASLFAPSPVGLIVIALISVPIAVARSDRFGAAVLVPLLIAIGSLFTPRHIYFPMRFESVLAAGFVLWLASSLHIWQRPVRLTLVAILLITGTIASYIGIADHMRRPLDGYREAALFAARQNPGLPIVASGYCYLETISTTDRPVIAYPPEQALHPGWRRRHTKEELDRAGSAVPAGMFLFVAERRTLEFHHLAEERQMRPMFYSEAAIVCITPPPRQP